MASNLKHSWEMSVKELKLSEEKYTAYMDGQKQRQWPLHIHISMDFGHSIDALRHAILQLKDIGVPRFEPGGFGIDHSRIIVAGSGHGKTAVLEAMMSDLYKYGHCITIAKERLEHVPFDSFANKLSFDSNKKADLTEWLAEQESVQKKVLDDPENWLSPEPPKQKKFRSCQPDKRALNRKSRKKK